MSIDQHARPPFDDDQDEIDLSALPADPEPTTAEDRPRRIDLSTSQVVGGALAAMTAAALGSRLGVAGTIAGAAVASIVAAVAGALYTASLRHTEAKVRTVFSSRPPEAGSILQRVPTPPESTIRAAALAPIQASSRRVRSRSRQPPPWKGPLLGALAAFVLAGVALTGFEALSGSALSGGDGTTIEQAAHPQRPVTKPATDPTKSSAPERKKSPEPSATETTSEPAPPTPTPSTQPTEQATTTGQPSASATPQPSASNEPSTPPRSEPSSTSPSEPASTDAPGGDETPAG